jgi:hypothetical protein
MGVGGSTVLSGGYLKSNPPGSAEGTIGHRPAKVGEWHYFTNHPMFLLKHPGGAYQGENAILREDTAPSGDQLWEGLGQQKVTERQMYNNMIYTYNLPRDQFDNRKLDQIRGSHGGTLPPEYDPANHVFPDRVDSVEDMLAAPSYTINGRERKGGYNPTSGKKLDADMVKDLRDMP